MQPGRFVARRRRAWRTAPFAASSNASRSSPILNPTMGSTWSSGSRRTTPSRRSRTSVGPQPVRSQAGRATAIIASVRSTHGGSRYGTVRITDCCRDFMAHNRSKLGVACCRGRHPRNRRCLDEATLAPACLSERAHRSTGDGHGDCPSHRGASCCVAALRRSHHEHGSGSQFRPNAPVVPRTRALGGSRETASETGAVASPSVSVPPNGQIRTPNRPPAREVPTVRDAEAHSRAGAPDWPSTCAECGSECSAGAVPFVSTHSRYRSRDAHTPQTFACLPVVHHSTEGQRPCAPHWAAMGRKRENDALPNYTNCD
jgi:hypothetical protein